MEIRNNPMRDLGWQARHQGAFFGGWLGVLLFLALLVAAAMKFVPTYLDHYAAREQIMGLKEATQGQTVGVTEVRTQLAKRLQMNNLKNMFDDGLVTIEEKRDRVTVSMDYEVKTPLIANVEFLITFDEQYEFGVERAD
jgi:hypothetical protein